MFYLDRVEPAEGGKRHEQEDGSRGPLGERVAFLGQFWIRSVWGDGSRLFSGHFLEVTLEGVRGRRASENGRSEPLESAICRRTTLLLRGASSARRVASTNQNTPASRWLQHCMMVGTNMR